MSVMHPPDSEYAKERVKWEAQNSVLGIGLRPYVKRDYPMMVFQAIAAPQGGFDIVDTRIAETADQRARFEREGFRPTPDEAIQQVKDEQREFAKLDAERAYEKVHKLSPKAIAEVEAVEAQTPSQHVPVIPETPIRPKLSRPVSPGLAELLAAERSAEEIAAQVATPAKKKKGGWPKGKPRGSKAAEKPVGGES